MLGYEVVEVGLTTKFVYSLRNLVTGGISKTREEREEFGGQWCTGGITKDDGR